MFIYRSVNGCSQIQFNWDCGITQSSNKPVYAEQSMRSGITNPANEVASDECLDCWSLIAFTQGRKSGFDCFLFEIKYKKKGKLGVPY